MRGPSTILACIALAAATASAVAQPAQQTSATAPAPAESATRAFLAAINGSSADRAAFARDAFSTRALEAENAQSRAAWLDRVASDTGGLALVSVSYPDERMAEAIVRTNRGGKFGKIVLFTSKAEPGKIADVFLLAARDPAKVAADAWPTGPLGVPQIAAEIEKRAAVLAGEDVFSGVLLVANGDQVIVRRAYGFADQAWRIPNRPDTAFHSGSVGKMFTAAAILKLAEQKRLSLDDTLARWVPEYPHPEAATVTLRHLLSHSAGIGEWDVRQKEPLTGAQAAARMTAPHPFPAGSRFEYSNGGFVLLGAVIEKVTGKPLADALRELVFEPAGMSRTGLWPVTAIMPDRATGYLRPPEDPLGLGPRYSNEQYLGFAGNGAGGAYTTADDLFAFTRALAGNRLLSADFTREMLTPRFDFAGAPRPMKYGYGVNVADCAGVPVFGHGGGGANSGVSADAIATLDGKWTVVLLSNYDPAADDFAHSICEFVAGR